MNSVERPRTSAFERMVWQTMAVLGSIAVWLVYDAFTFVVSSLSVADSNRGERAFATVLLLVPLAILAGIAAFRFLRRDRVPLSAFGRIMAFVKLVGAAALVVAFLYPPLALSSYFHPRAELSVENRTGEIAGVMLNGGEYSGCGGWQIVQPGTSDRVRVTFTSYECWGQHVTTLEVNSGFRHWQCDWSAAKAREPVIITDEGLNC